MLHCLFQPGSAASSKQVTVLKRLAYTAKRAADASALKEEEGRNAKAGFKTKCWRRGSELNRVLLHRTK